MSYKCVFTKINGLLCLDCLEYISGTEKKDVVEYIDYCGDYDSLNINVELDTWCIGTGQIEDYNEDDFAKEFGMYQEDLIELYDNGELEKTLENKRIYYERLKYDEYSLELESGED